MISTYSVVIRWNPAGTTAYDEPRVERCQIRRGRQSEQLLVEQGRCVLEIADPDGVYNPASGTSPLGANLTVMRPVVVGMTAPADDLIDDPGVGLTDDLGATLGDEATAGTLFTGYVSRIVHDPVVGPKTTVIEAVDAFEVLNLVFPTIAPTGLTTSGAIVGSILDAAGISPTARDLDVGDVLPSFAADGTRTALQLIDDLLLVDRGTYFVAADGRHTYRSRASLYGRRPTQATLTPAQADVVLPAVDAANIVNRQSARALPSGALQTANDATSQASYFVRTGAAIESVLLAGDAQAGSLASFVVLTRANPDLPTRTLRLPGMTVTQARQQAERDVGDLVALVGLGTTPEARIEGASHEIDRDQHVTEYALTTRVGAAGASGYAFAIGVSTVGGPDVISY